MTSHSKTILRAAAGCALILGIVTWIAAFVFGGGGLTARIPSHIQLPLGEAGDIAVDDNYIYVTSIPYARVQVYDLNGHFIRGWYVDAGGGVFSVAVDEAGLVHIGTARVDMHYVYTPSGRLVSKEKDRDAYDRFLDDREAANRETGAVYRVSRRIVWPQVVEISPSGERSILVRTPFFLWLVGAPFPAWFFIAISIIILGALQKQNDRQGYVDQ